MSSLDAAEFILKRAMIAGVVLLALAIGLALWLGNGQGSVQGPVQGAAAGRAPSGGGAGGSNPASSPALASPASAAQPQASTTHTLTIHLPGHLPGDYSVRFANLPHSAQMTVLDLLLAAKARPALAPASSLRFEHSGSGPTAFISSIEGIANEGGGKTARNWQFWVNSQMGQTGAGSAILYPGDRVVWAFTLWDDTQRPPEP